MWKEHVISIDNILVENLELVYNAEEPIPKLTKKKGHKLASKLLSEIDRLQISQGDIKLKYLTGNKFIIVKMLIY